jgi:hypothetical protein
MRPTGRPHHLSRREARRIAVRAQLLARERPADLISAVRWLTLLQLDPTNAIAPSAELVAWSRLGSSYSPQDLREALGNHRFRVADLVRRPPRRQARREGGPQGRRSGGERDPSGRAVHGGDGSRRRQGNRQPRDLAQAGRAARRLRNFRPGPRSGKALSRFNAGLPDAAIWPGGPVFVLSGPSVYRPVTAREQGLCRASTGLGGRSA